MKEITSEKKAARWSRAWELLPMLLGLVLVMVQLFPFQGRMGHDYYHYFSRIILGVFHFWQNGFDIPHYTPSLCGGIPFFADPQSMYYSVPQFLAFGIDPLAATLLTFALFYGLGYWGFFRLLNRVFLAGPRVSHLGALLFLLNGFTFAHLLVGHVTHHSYLLFPWLFYFLLIRSLPSRRLFLKNTCLFSLTIIYTFYSGGLHVLVVFFWGLFLLSPYLVYRMKGEKRLLELGGFLAISVLFVVAAVSGKAAQSVLLSRSFVQSEIDSSGMGIFWLTLQYFWLNTLKTPIVVHFGKWAFGPWEYVGFVSKGLLFFVPALFVLQLLRISVSRFFLCVVYICAVYLFLLVASGTTFNQSLPFFRSYHNPIKILGAGIPVLILAAAVTVSTFSKLRWWPKASEPAATVLFLLFGLILLVEFRNYALYFRRNPLVYGFMYPAGLYGKMKKEQRLPSVVRVTQEYGKDVSGIFTGCTSLKCYEPMFGYRRETFKAQLVEGDTKLVAGGRFNMTHPGCLLYPDHFRCDRWSRIPGADSEDFYLFVNGRTPKWGVPTWQTLLFSMNFLTLALLVWGAWGRWLMEPGLDLLKNVFSRRSEEAA